VKRVGLALALSACGCPTAAEVELGGASFCVEVARTEAERTRGLRGRAPLGPDEGLLLAFPVEDEICVVNDGVGFALDVAYASGEGTVVAIEREVPADDGTPRCHGSTRDVLEVPAGALSAAAVGDRMTIRR